MTGQILLALVGLFSGAVIASGVVAFMISLRIVPRMRESQGRRSG